MVRRVENKDNSPQSVQVYMTTTEKVSIEIYLLADCLHNLVSSSWLPAHKSLRSCSPAKQAWRQCYSPRSDQGCSRERGCGYPVQLGLAQEGGCINSGENEIQTQDHCCHMTQERQATTSNQLRQGRTDPSLLSRSRPRLLTRLMCSKKGLKQKPKFLPWAAMCIMTF